MIDGVVFPDWIDINGHMNVAHYMDIFDKSMFNLLARMHINEQSIREGRLTMVASRINMAYRKELLEGDDFQIWAGITGIGGHSMTVSQRLMRGSVAYATCDILAISFSPVERRAVAMEEHVRARAEEFVVDGMKDPFAALKPGTQ